MGKITVVGLGPGRAGLITREAWELMEKADDLRLRTGIHPTVSALDDAGVKYTTYDHMYETAGSFAELYDSIAKNLADDAKDKDIVYAVPGSPLVAEQTVVLLRDMSRRPGAGFKLTILPGMSFAEVLYTELGIDPLGGVAILDAEDIESLPPDNKLGLVVTQVYDTRTASDAKLSLMDIYPEDYEVIFVYHLGMSDEDLRHIPLYELDCQKDIDHLTSVFVPIRK